MSGPVICDHGVTVSVSTSSGMGMPIGMGLSTTGTQLLCGLASMPPSIPRVSPLGVYPVVGAGLGVEHTPPSAIWLGAQFGVGCAAPAAARTRSTAAALPGEYFATRLPRSM